MKYLAFFSSLLLVVCSIQAAEPQRGGGHGTGPSVNQGHGQAGSDDHAKTDTASHGAGGHDAAWETKFNERFQNDAAFHAKIQSLLPPNTDLKTAESGFKNHGQFIAALHVSHNLG